MSDEPRALSPGELESEEAINLPNREVMTLITTLPHLPVAMPEGSDPTTLAGAPDQATTPADTTGTPTDAGGATHLASDSAASQSGEPSVTDQPRSEDFSSTETATSVT